MLLMMLSSVLMTGCQGTRFAPFPAPKHPCPTVEEADWLADQVPAARTDIKARDTLRKFVAAAAYCRTAHKRL